MAAYDCYLWRHFAHEGENRGEYQAWAPVGRDASGMNYAVCVLTEGGAGLLRPTELWLAKACRPLGLSTGTASGNWVRTANMNAVGGETLCSRTEGDVYTGSAVGATLGIAHRCSPLGGFALVRVDNGGTPANRLPRVTEHHFKAITEVFDNGAGICRVRCPNHGFRSGAIVKLAGISANGLDAKWPILVNDEHYFDCIGSNYQSPSVGEVNGKASYFRPADIGSAYIDMHSDNGTIADIRTVVAEHLESTTHAISIEVLGTARGGGALSGETCVSALLTDWPVDEAGALMLPLAKCKLNSPHGDNHDLTLLAGNELAVGELSERPLDGNQQNGDWRIDGQDIVLHKGGKCSGSEIVYSGLTDFVHAAFPFQTAATRRMDLTVSADSTCAVTVHKRWYWRLEGAVTRVVRATSHFSNSVNDNLAVPIDWVQLGDGAREPLDERVLTLRPIQRNARKATFGLDGQPVQFALYDLTPTIKGAREEAIASGRLEVVPAPHGGITALIARDSEPERARVTPQSQLDIVTGWHVRRSEEGEADAVVARSWLGTVPGASVRYSVRNGACREVDCMTHGPVWTPVARGDRPSFYARIVKAADVDAPVDLTSIEMVLFTLREIEEPTLCSQSQTDAAAPFVRTDDWVDESTLSGIAAIPPRTTIRLPIRRVFSNMWRFALGGQGAPFNFCWLPSCSMSTRAGGLYTAHFHIVWRSGDRTDWRHGIRVTL